MMCPLNAIEVSFDRPPFIRRNFSKKSQTQMTWPPPVHGVADIRRRQITHTEPFVHDVHDVHDVHAVSCCPAAYGIFSLRSEANERPR